MTQTTFSILYRIESNHNGKDDHVNDQTNENDVSCLRYFNLLLMITNLLNLRISHCVEETIKNDDNDSSQPVLDPLKLLKLYVFKAYLR